MSDDVAAIQAKLLEWCDGPSPAHVVFTTGGTGFGVSVCSFCWLPYRESIVPGVRQVRDVTPEATRPLLHRPAIGLVIAMMSYGLQVRPDRGTVYSCCISSFLAVDCCHVVR